MDELQTIRDHIRFVYTQLARSAVFFGHGTDNAYDEAVQLVLFSLELPWDVPDSMWNARLTSEEKEDITVKLNKRVNDRVPLPYLTNKAWFCGHQFYVDERVLIPRSPIGEMIEMGFQPWLKVDSPKRILDLCSGSGCIGIACAHEFQEAEIHLGEISGDALAVAKLNIEQHGLQGRIVEHKSDVFKNIAPELGPFDLIVSNPPYVDQDDIASMPEEYAQEPSIALGSGHDGLDVTKRILRQAGEYLAADGLLVIEVGNSWEAIEQAYPEFAFTWVEFERGGHGVFVMSAEELNSNSW